MPLSERKKKILQAVVDDYIESAEPVSSKNIQEKYLRDCSSATIRNELSALESMGYLVQPHVSAGRIPSQKAYRMYVDEMMQSKQLSKKEIALIDSYFSEKIGSVEDIVSNVARVLTDITNYTSVAIKTPADYDTIKTIKLIPVGGESALVVIVTDLNLYKDSIIQVKKGAGEEEISTAEQWLNKIFAGKHMNEFREESAAQEMVQEEFSQFKELYERVKEVICKAASARVKVITEGTSKILNYPEYSDTQKAKEFFSTMEEKTRVAEILDDDGDLNVKIRFGKESDDCLPDDCAVVSAKIVLNDKTIGSAGVVGPARMNYPKVVAVLKHVSERLDHILDDSKKED